MTTEKKATTNKAKIINIYARKHKGLCRKLSRYSMKSSVKFLKMFSFDKKKKGSVK